MVWHIPTIANQASAIAKWVATIALASLGLLILAIVLLYALSPDLPELATGLPKHADMAVRAFDDRTRKKFPIGSSPSMAVAELSRQGFKIDGNTAEFQDVSVVCSNSYNVSWKLDRNGNIASITGFLHISCL